MVRIREMEKKEQKKIEVNDKLSPNVNTLTH